MTRQKCEADPGGGTLLSGLSLLACFHAQQKPLFLGTALSTVVLALLHQLANKKMPRKHGQRQYGPGSSSVEALSAGNEVYVQLTTEDNIMIPRLLATVKALGA